MASSEGMACLVNHNLCNGSIWWTRGRETRGSGHGQIDTHICYNVNNILSCGWGLRYIRTSISAEKTAVFGCLTNAIAPPPIVLESCSRAQTDRPVQ